MLGKLRTDVLVKDVTHYPLPRHGLVGTNAEFTMWKRIRSKYPSLNREFYGLNLHDTPGDYLFSDHGVWPCAEGPIVFDIIYGKTNDFLSERLRGYMLQKYGELASPREYDETVRNKTGSLTIYPGSKEPPGVLGVELIPSCSVPPADIQPEAVAKELSDLTSYLLSKL